jgi:hypothetical protein
MSSEWMKVMLDEIARKKVQAEQDQIELERRSTEHEGQSAPAASHSRDVGDEGRADDSARSR